MKAIYLVYFISIFFSISISAQDTTFIYYNSDWEEINDIDDASFYRKAFKDTNDLWMAYDYYISGNIQMVATFKSKKYEKQQGYTTYYYEDGQKTSEGKYIKGLRYGEWNFWHETGELRSKGVFVKDEKTGNWEGWHDNGQQSFFGNYDNGTKTGIWNIFYETGELSEKSKHSNNSTIHTEGYHKNGNMSYSGQIISGQKSGQWNWSNYEGKIYFEGNYKNGLKHGLWIRHCKEEKFEIEYSYGIVEGKQFGGVVRRK